MCLCLTFPFPFSYLDWSCPWPQWWSSRSCSPRRRLAAGSRPRVDLEANPPPERRNGQDPHQRQRVRKERDCEGLMGKQRELWEISRNMWVVLDCDSNSPPRCQRGADDFHCVEYYEGVLSGFSLRPAVAQHGLEKNVIQSNLKMLLLLLLTI